MEATAVNPFARREEVLERLKQGPGDEARQEVIVGVDGPPPRRWTLVTIRATFEEICDHTLSGVWRWLLNRVGAKLRSGRVQQYSPDPEYRQKVRRLKRCLRKAARNPDQVVLVFLDEMGYESWPEPGGHYPSGPCLGNPR